MKIGDALGSSSPRSCPGASRLRRQLGRHRRGRHHPAPEEPARPGLPAHRARRPRPGPRLRDGRPRHPRRPPGRPLRRADAALPQPQVPRADAGRGAADRARPGLVQPQAAARPAAGDAAALAPYGRGPAPLDGSRRRRDPPPLRRLQPLLRDGAGSLDDLHLRGLPPRGRHPRGGAGLQVRPGRPQARPQARHAAARRRLRLGRHGPLRRPRVRRQGARRDALGRAGVVGQAGHRPRGPGRPRRGAPRRLPRRARGRLRRDQLDRADRAHRRAPVPRTTSGSSRTSCARRAGCSTTASPARTTVARRPARSSTATSSPTAS